MSLVAQTDQCRSGVHMGFILPLNTSNIYEINA